MAFSKWVGQAGQDETEKKGLGCFSALLSLPFYFSHRSVDDTTTPSLSMAAQEDYGDSLGRSRHSDPVGQRGHFVRFRPFSAIPMILRCSAHFALFAPRKGLESVRGLDPLTVRDERWNL